MYRSILLPLDGSVLAEAAIPYAAALARASGARIIALQAPLERLLDPLDLPERYLASVQRRLQARGVNTEIAIAGGMAPAVIVHQARTRQVDLIVMATHGHSGLSRWLCGSVAEEVLHQAEVPVLLIPATCTRRWPPGGGSLAAGDTGAQPLPSAHSAPSTAPAPSGGVLPAPSAASTTPASRPFRLLVTLDGSPLAEAVLTPASVFAQVVNADLALLQILTALPAAPAAPVVDAPPPGSAAAASTLAAARRYLESIAATLEARGHRVMVQVCAGPAISTIAAIARAWDADTIAMATHGRTGLGRVVLGSTAAGVVHESALPVLLVRPAGLHRS